MSKKQNKILRYTEMLYSKPHLVSEDSFRVITEYLDNRNNFKLMQIDAPTAPDIDDDGGVNYDEMSGVGVIDISGTLTNEPVVTMCGVVGTSYESILEQAEEMIEAGVKKIVLDIDSGGGEAFNCFTSVDQFRKMCDEAGVRVYTYVDGMAASAAYAWACAADEVIAPVDAEVGSIGVLIALANMNKYYENQGITRTWVSAGADKIPFDENGDFKDSFLSDLQYKVDTLYSMFVQHVSKYTGLSADEIKATEAKTFLSNDAIKIGLVNKVMNKFDFVNYVLGKKD
jgi:signal peptide peptidase SppA